MSDWAWIVAGGAAATGFLGAFWGYVKGFWQSIASFAIVSSEVRGSLSDAVTFHFWHGFKTSPLGLRCYIGWWEYVRPVKRRQVVPMEVIGNTTKLYWYGWRPIWISRISNKEEAQLRTTDTCIQTGVQLTFFRGTFDIDQLVQESADSYNQFHTTIDTAANPRYFIRHIFGTAGKPASTNNDNEATLAACGGGSSSRELHSQHRLLRWHERDLGEGRINHGNALSYLALDSDALMMVEEVRRWKTSEDWYKDRGIPWRRSWLLHGKPGTGKTATIRAVAEDFDLPIFVYNLSTLYNNEMQAAWKNMLANVPCIALIEDIDNVFDGRENTAGGHLSFDCLLNCLDGVERADGVLLIVTTNCLEKLDSALGIPDGDVSTRPGRIDRILEMKELSQEGRQLLCERILKEWPGVWHDTILYGAGETGAQFQERCTRKALSLYWKT